MSCIDELIVLFAYETHSKISLHLNIFDAAVDVTSSGKSSIQMFVHIV